MIIQVPEDEGQHDEAPAQHEAHDEAGANAVILIFFVHKKHIVYPFLF